MYGLVNLAIKSLIEKDHGAEVWSEIASRAGCPGTFGGMTSYPDEVTYRLVAEASERLQAPAEALLRAFGRYWVLYTAKEGYGDLLDRSGRNLEDFLVHLDDMHARVAFSMPELQPPSFEVERCADDVLCVRYYSDRPGLAPMVVGLLEGLIERFGERRVVEHVPESEEPGEIFLVKPAA